jgi:sigma-E factor negative regulatory protein RseA
MSEKSSQDQARERLKESLSVSLDGHASELELRRVLDGVGYDDELRSTASRYQLIGDAIRGETNQFAGVDLSAGIMGAIEREDQAASWADQGSKATREESGKASVLTMLDGWWSSLGRVAMAASVAFAVVFGVRNVQINQDAQTLAVSDPTVLNQPVQLTTGGGSGYGASGILAGYNSRQHDSITPEQLAYAQGIADQATKERFRAYALHHAELSAVHGGQGVLPFARLTSFDTQ